MDDDDAIVLAGYDELMGHRRGRVAAARRTMARNLPSAGGSKLLRQFVAFPVYTFSSSSGTLLSQTIQPQRPVSIDRLIVAVGRNGPSATGLVTVQQFFIGAENMLATVGAVGVPVELFAANATNARFRSYTAKAGTIITLALAITTAPGSSDTVVVTVGGYASAIA